MNYMNISEFSKKVNRTVKCVQMWDRTGVLKPSTRSVTNRRMYTDSDVFKALGLSYNETKPSRIVCYCRVSNSSQKDDLKNQKSYITDYCISTGKNDFEIITDIGSGLNFKRKQFSKLMIEVECGNITEIIISHKDRLVRFGYDWFNDFCQRHGCIITVINNEKTSPESEMVKDLISIIHVFSCRLYGLRKYKQAILNENK